MIAINSMMSQYLAISLIIMVSFQCYTINAYMPPSISSHARRIDPPSFVIRYKNSEIPNFNTKYRYSRLNQKSYSSTNNESQLNAFNERMKEIEDTTKSRPINWFDPLQLNDQRKINNDFNKDIDDNEEPSLSLWTARVILLSVSILWGTNFASVKYLENICFNPPCDHLPSEAALARFGLAAMASLPFLWKQRNDVILAGLECGLWVAFGYYAQALSLSTISAGKCAFICSLTVVVVPLLSATLFGKEIKPVHMASGALALAGVGVLEGLVDFHAIFNVQPALADIATTTTVPVLDSTSDIVSSATSSVAATAVVKSASAFTNFVQVTGIAKGDLLALGQPLGFGLAFMRIEHYVEKFKNVENRIMTLSAAQCVAVGMISLFWVLFDFHGTIPNMEYMIEPHRLGAVAWTGIMTTVVGIYLEGFALQVASATEAALIFASEPIWASLFGAWLLREELNINSYVGGSIILGACILSALNDDEDEVVKLIETETVKEK